MNVLCKRVLTGLLAVSLLTGCSAGAAVKESGGDAKAQAETTAGGEAESKLKPIAKEDLKIGVIHMTDPAEGSGYSYNHDLGIQYMQEQLNLDDSQIVRKIKVDDTDPTAIENALLECIEEGCNFIVAPSWGYQETVKVIAEEYPEIYFVNGGRMANGRNCINYFGRIYQVRYLSGIVAGLKTKTNKIGFIAAQNNTNAQVTGGVDSFAMGVYAVNPEAKVYLKVTNSWYNPEAETAAAKALLADGCDVLAQHCDTPNPQTAAEEAGVWSIGYNSDTSKDAPDASLCSVMWNWGAFYTSAAQMIMDGTWDGKDYYGGIGDGIVYLSELADFCEPGTAEKVEEVKQTMLDGTFNVYDGVIETNDGKTIGEEGKTLDDLVIQDEINWYFKNVVE